MLGDQKQNATEGSTAIQVGGNANVNTGLTPGQLVEILSALSSHVDKLTDVAKGQIEARLKAFESGVMERFATDKATRSEAFRDPDFLAATLDAQKAFARSGDEGLREVLTDLVAQRSKFSERSRLSLTLNDAIAKVGSIPESDLNMISMIFAFQNVQNNGLATMQQLAAFLSSICLPLLEDISSSESAANYLAAHGCIIPQSDIIVQLSAFEILKKRYGHIITKGVTEAQLRNKFDDYDRLLSRGLIVDSPYGNSHKVFAFSGPSLETILAEIGVFGHYSARYSELTENSQPSESEFQKVMSAHLPRISEIMTTYDQTTIRNSRLTSIGIALAHANLAKGPLRDIDLSVWIRP